MYLIKRKLVMNRGILKSILIILTLSDADSTYVSTETSLTMHVGFWKGETGPWPFSPSMI